MVAGRQNSGSYFPLLRFASLMTVASLVFTIVSSEIIMPRPYPMFARPVNLADQPYISSKTVGIVVNNK